MRKSFYVKYVIQVNKICVYIRDQIKREKKKRVHIFYSHCSRTAQSYRNGKTIETETELNGLKLHHWIELSFEIRISAGSIFQKKSSQQKSPKLHMILSMTRPYRRFIHSKSNMNTTILANLNFECWQHHSANKNKTSNMENCKRFIHGIILVASYVGENCLIESHTHTWQIDEGKGETQRQTYGGSFCGGGGGVWKLKCEPKASCANGW